MGTLIGLGTFGGIAGLPGAAGQSSQVPEFADWSTAGANAAAGTLRGVPISLSGSRVDPPPASVVDGSSTIFSQPFFSPPLPASDAVAFYGFPGYSYMLQFGAPTRDPVLHLASLASTIAFAPGTQVTKLSGQSTFTVAADTVTGAVEGSTDANGTARLSGTFRSVAFTATPVFAASTEDGIYLQVGAPPPLEPTQLPAESTQPTKLKSLADLPPPVIGRIVNVAPVRGNVLVAVPAGGSAATGSGRAGAAQEGLRFVPLREATRIPTGSFLDTRGGTVRLQSAARGRQLRQTGDFAGGLFQVGQARRGKQRALTELRLKGSSFRACSVRTRGSRAAARRGGRRVIRRLRGSARGRFRTRGRYSSATVRGTAWATIDRCDGTLTTVRRGKVAVRDFRGRRGILLRAGKRHLARAPR